MRILILLTFCSVLSISNINAQIFQDTQEIGKIEIGAKVGFTTSILSSGDFGTKEIRIGLIGGVFASYAFSERFFLQLDATLAERGGNFGQSKEPTGPSLLVESIHLTAIDLPLTAVYNVRYKLFGMEMHFDVFGGISPGIYIDKQINEKDADDSIRDLDIAATFGAGFTFGRVILNATNKIGLVDIADFDPAPGANLDPVKSLSTEWTAGYRF